ncbi:hypothetical protein [Ruminococcus sp.]|uniref:hypothetical protein n=1 Tax=Ruminococcus sp. TaxID=41978 RepID=UPI002C003270|nr:hypothetical protein [Ruminococcus sp.]HNZ98245.1 hypothetical protein [Ruminococcus sp.]HOH88446.1 hypothetical protein [Ruminococcus sp.]
MKKTNIFVAALLISAVSLCSCSDKVSSSSTVVQETTAAETTALETTAEPATEQVTAPQQEVGYEGMEAVYADSVKEGEYDIDVDSSSTMFKITECRLTVAEGAMTARLTMSGNGYGYLFLGTGEDAEKAEESEYIPPEEEGDAVAFTVPVEALDKEIDCAAFSKKKEQWYDRKLVFRADSLPKGAIAGDEDVTPETLGLSDGEYTIEVSLEGGSGKASVQSPAKLTVENGQAYAELIWSSNKYDYMVVDGEKILPTSTEEFSVFDIPVASLSGRMAVSADTTAMSTPHEISYTLIFDPDSIK